MNKLLAIAVVVMLVFAVSGNGYAWFLDFEWGLGHDGEAIGSDITGLQFTTVDGGDWLYGDITTGMHHAQNERDEGIYGEFFMEGYVFAMIEAGETVGRIDFANQDASNFTAGYSAIRDFYIEAYDASGNLLDAQVGPANSRMYGGTGLDYLTVSSADSNIAYVLLHHNLGNKWLIDNISSDASGVEYPIPEPGTLILLGMGFIGVGLLHRRLCR